VAHAVSKYLAQWAEPQAALSQSLAQRYAFGLAIPALAEGPGLVDTLQTIALDRGAPLVVVVVNSSENATPAQTGMNRETICAIAGQWPVVRMLSEFATMHAFGDGHLITLDVILSRKRAGVGLARKIGHDVLLSAWSRERIASDWLYSTDADVRIPPDFFDPPSPSETAAPKAAAMLQPFTHVPVEPALSDATMRYEARLRHHVLGLRYAGSAYAFHNIGSTIACNAQSYAQVRGFPVRAAAEDFYLLSKLSKVGSVIQRRGRPLEIAGRRSWRVPFGTGAAITRAAAPDDARPPLCYHPALFQLLRLALKVMHAAVEHGSPLNSVIQDTASGLDSNRLALWRHGLEQRAVARLVDTVNASGLPADRRHRRLKDGFDALQTLKLMHAWRAGGLPDVSVERALQESVFCPEPPTELEAVCAYLARLEISTAMPPHVPACTP